MILVALALYSHSEWGLNHTAKRYQNENCMCQGLEKHQDVAPFGNSKQILPEEHNKIHPIKFSPGVVHFQKFRIMCLTEVIFSGYQFLIMCLILKKVQFVRQITLGVNHSCSAINITWGLHYMTINVLICRISIQQICLYLKTPQTAASIINDQFYQKIYIGFHSKQCIFLNRNYEIHRKII